MSSPRHVTLCGRTFDRPGHICAFFNSREQEYDVLTPYYVEGLEQGEQVINIVDAHRHTDHHVQMAARGVPVDDALANNQLKVLTSEETYTLGGKFSAHAMYDMLQGALAAARRDGRKVRTSGVMDWSARGVAGTEELMDYEARVNVLVPMYDCTLLCVYDLDTLNGAAVMDILRTHPYVIHGRHVLENPYYTAPLDVLKEQLVGERHAHSAPETQRGQLPA